MSKINNKMIAEAMELRTAGKSYSVIADKLGVSTATLQTAYYKAQKEGMIDTKRIDWLADKDNLVGNVQLPTECVESNLDSLRGAIDTAMEINK